MQFGNKLELKQLELARVFAESLGLFVPHGQSVSGHMV